MKCPKCGYNSFEYYDTCKKCSADLIGYKQTHSITPIVLPVEIREQMAAELKMASQEESQVDDVQESHDDIFAFDLPDDNSGSATLDDPFNFDEPASSAPAAAAQSEDDLFADLLESTSQTDESPFASSASTSAAPPAAATPAGFSSGAGEFDLESFSWDETPAAPTEAGQGGGTTDDFDSLFGDMKESDSK